MGERRATIIRWDEAERKAVARIVKSYGVDSMQAALRLLVREKDLQIKRLAAKVGNA